MIPDDFSYYELSQEEIDAGWECSKTQTHLLYFYKAKLHDAPNGDPAYRTWHNNGQLASRIYYQHGKYQDARSQIIPFLAEPAKTVWYEDGTLQYKTFYSNGKCSNPLEDLLPVPAHTAYHDNGQIACIIFKVDGAKQDPQDGSPAEVEWDKAGVVSSEAHYSEDKLHSPNSSTPAVTRYDTEGEITEEIFYEHGTRLGSLYKEEKIQSIGWGRKII